jgi:hypothetical protein
VEVVVLNNCCVPTPSRTPFTAAAGSSASSPAPASSSFIFDSEDIKAQEGPGEQLDGRAKGEIKQGQMKYMPTKGQFKGVAEICSGKEGAGQFKGCRGNMQENVHIPV